MALRPALSRLVRSPQLVLLVAITAVAALVMWAISGSGRAVPAARGGPEPSADRGAVGLAAPPPGEGTSQPSGPSGARGLQLLDLGTGRPMSAVRVEYQPLGLDGVWREGTSDGEGRVEVAFPGRLRVPAGAGWHVAARGWRQAARWPPMPVPSEGPVWGFRSVRVFGRVRGALVTGPDPQAIGGATVGACFTGLETPTAGERRGARVVPWSGDWVADVGIHERVEATTDAEGRFELWVPQMLGTSLRVRCRGWRTEYVGVPTGKPDDSPFPVEVLLGPATVVRGKVRSAGGDVPDGTKLVAYVLEEVDPGSITPEKLRDMYAGVAYSRLRDGRAYVRTMQELQVGPDGGFAFEPAHRGRIQLVVHAPGMVPARVSVESGDDAPRQVDLEIRRAPGGRRVAFTVNGVPLGGARLLLVDRTDDPMQTSALLALDAAGTCDEAWLELGRQYSIRGGVERASGDPSRALRGRLDLRWDGRARVELEPMGAGGSGREEGSR